MRVGERVRTHARLTLPEEFEAMLPLLAEKEGEVVEVRDYTITVDGGRGGTIPLKTAVVRLDHLRDHTIHFVIDELDVVS